MGGPYIWYLKKMGNKQVLAKNTEAVTNIQGHVTEGKGLRGLLCQRRDRRTWKEEVLFFCSRKKKELGTPIQDDGRFGQRDGDCNEETLRPSATLLKREGKRVFVPEGRPSAIKGKKRGLMRDCLPAGSPQSKRGTKRLDGKRRVKYRAWWKEGWSSEKGMKQGTVDPPGALREGRRE